MRIKRIFSLLLLLTLLTACGFRLPIHEEVANELTHVLVTSDVGYSEISTQLLHSLKRQGVTTVSDVKQAQLMINITDDHFNQNAMDVFQPQQNPQLVMEYRVNFTVSTNGGEILSGPQILSTQRGLLIQSGALQGYENEINIIRKEMANDLVQQIIRHLSTPTILNYLQNEAES